MSARRKKLNDVNAEYVSHAGVVLTRWLSMPVKADGHAAERVELIEHVAQACKRVKAVYTIAFQERKTRLDTTRARYFSAKISSRLAVGLGIASPIEFGLHLHHVYGVPIILGSALKGIARRAWIAVAKSQKGVSDVEGAQILFGDADSAGFITFHDAWIDPTSLSTAISRDVLTPHHSKYHGQTSVTGRGHDPPTDFDTPAPNTFVSVTGLMHFALSCTDVSPQGMDWLELAVGLLQFALKELGVGGKTTSEYGTFSSFEPQSSLLPEFVQIMHATSTYQSITGGDP